MLHQWDFLTGSLPRARERSGTRTTSRRQVDAGQIDHTPAALRDRPRRAGSPSRSTDSRWPTTAVAQQAQIVRRGLPRLLPGHPSVRSHLSYEEIPTVGPATALAAASGRRDRCAVGAARRSSLLFFATWLTESSDLAGRLESTAPTRRLARGSDTPTPHRDRRGQRRAVARSAGVRFLAGPPPPAAVSTVGIDGSGRLADGYQVQDQPWFVLELARRDGSSGTGMPRPPGWLTPADLAEHVARRPRRAAERAAPPRCAQTSAPVSPGHRRPSRACTARREDCSATSPRSRRGCVRCGATRSCSTLGVVVPGPSPPEWPLLAAAALRYGRRVAFVGVDTKRPHPRRRSLLAGHAVSYPSYVSLSGAIPRKGVIGLPTTIFIDAAGNITYTQTGPYDSQGSFDADISRHAL